MKSYNCELLFQSSEDRSKLLHTLDLQRQAFNICSQTLFGMNGHRKAVGIVDLHKNCYFSIKEQIPGIPAQVVIRAEHDAKSAYRTVRSNKHKIKSPIVKSKLSMRLDARICTFKEQNTKVKLSVAGDKRILASIKLYPKVQELIGKYPLCDPLIFVRQDRVYITLTFDVPVPVHQPNSVVGVDLGKRLLVCTSEGKAIKGQAYNKNKRRIRYNKRCLQSKGTKSAKRHLKKIRRKESNYNKNYIHQVANWLLTSTDSNTLVLEDLTKIKQKIKKNKFHNINSLSQIPFFMLRQYIEYKALLMGKRVVTVNPFDTSRNDSRGFRKGERVGRRYYAVDGKVLDAEINAAINIALKHNEHPVSFVDPIDGSMKPYGQATVNRPIVENCILINSQKAGFLQAPEFIRG